MSEVTVHHCHALIHCYRCITGRSAEESIVANTATMPLSTTHPFEEGLDLDHPLESLVRMINRLSDASHRQKMKFIEPSVQKHMAHDELTSFLRKYAADYPEITRLYSVGRSVNHQDLWVLEITDQPGVHEPGKAITSFFEFWMSSIITPV